MASPIDGPHERDGRFYGPDGSWRFYTGDERDLASSLERMENNDLSAHLYNTHRLRIKHRNRSAVRPWQSKQSWAAHEPARFSADRGWSAWPLASADVPRRDEQWGVPLPAQDEDDDAAAAATAAATATATFRPSAELRECVQAEILRQAKDRFHQRTCFGARPPPVVPDAASDSRSSSDEASDAPRRSGEDHRPAARFRVTADEQLAETLTRPTVSHIISQLDDILLGLHRSRRDQYAPRSRSRTGPAASRSTSHADRRRVEPAALSPRAGVQEQDPSTPDQSPERGDRCTAPRAHPQRQELGTRDWSEVLGVAALVAWDPSIVARAASRCAALFDEHMTFRTMPETSAGKARDNPSTHLQAALGAAASPEEAEKAVLATHASTHGHCCPHAYCSRHREPYLQRWRLREHLKRKHKHTGVEIHDLVGKAGPPAAVTGPTNISVDDEDQRAEVAMQCGTFPSQAAIEKEEYLQPVLINVGRSKDRKVRRTPVRGHLRRKSGLQQGAAGDEQSPH